MVQGMSPMGMYPSYGGYGNYGFQGVPQQYAPQAQQQKTPEKGSNLFKNILKTIGTVAVIAGGLVVANKKGWVKQVDNPTKTWDKIQTALAKSGDSVEKTTLNWYNRAKSFATKQKNTEQIIKKAGLDKVA